MAHRADYDAALQELGRAERAFEIARDRVVVLEQDVELQSELTRDAFRAVADGRTRMVEGGPVDAGVVSQA